MPHCPDPWVPRRVPEQGILPSSPSLARRVLRYRVMHIGLAALVAAWGLLSCGSRLSGQCRLERAECGLSFQRRMLPDCCLSDVTTLAGVCQIHGTASSKLFISSGIRDAGRALCHYRISKMAARSLLQKSDGSRDPANRQSEALEMTEIWPPDGAIAHFRAVSMCRVSLDTAVDTFATGS